MAYGKFERSDNSEDIDHKLIHLAQRAVSRNLSPYQTRQLLRDIDKNNLQKFFIYYSLFKKGNLTDESYDDTVKVFREKFESAMIEKHTIPFGKSILFNTLMSEVNQGEENGDDAMEIQTCAF